MPSPRPSTKRLLGSIWKLGGLTFWQLTTRVVHGIEEDDLLGRASELAFNFLLALFPLLLVMFTLFGLFASRSSQLQSSLLSYFAEVLPPGAFQLLREISSELSRQAASSKLTLGIALALWFASGGTSSMISTLNAAYHVRESRSWFKTRAIALGLTLVISSLLLTALFLVLAGGHLVNWIGRELQLGSLVMIAWRALQWGIAVSFVMLSFSLIYYCGPTQGKRHWYWGTPGSMLGTFLWLVASAGFRVYLHFFNTYSATYGSLGAVMILLVWLYVTGLALLVGGVVNAEIERAAARAYLEDLSQAQEVAAQTGPAASSQELA
jgi:membrane protein